MPGHKADIDPLLIFHDLSRAPHQSTSFHEINKKHSKLKVRQDQQIRSVVNCYILEADGKSAHGYQQDSCT